MNDKDSDKEAHSCDVAFIVLLHTVDSLYSADICIRCCDVINWQPPIRCVRDRIVTKLLFLVKRNRFQWRKEHRVILNSFGVTVSFCACLSLAGYATINDSYSNDIVALFVTINFLCDPLMYFYFNYGLENRDNVRRSRMVNGRRNYHRNTTNV